MGCSVAPLSVESAAYPSLTKRNVKIRSSSRCLSAGCAQKGRTLSEILDFFWTLHCACCITIIHPTILPNPASICHCTRGMKRTRVQITCSRTAPSPPNPTSPILYHLCRPLETKQRPRKHLIHVHRVAKHHMIHVFQASSRPLCVINSPPCLCLPLTPPRSRIMISVRSISAVITRKGKRERERAGEYRK